MGRVWSRSPAGISSALDLLPVMISGAGYPLRVSRPAGVWSPVLYNVGRVCCPYQVDGFGGLLRWDWLGVGGAVAGLRSRSCISPAGWISSEGLRLSYPRRGSLRMLCGGSPLRLSLLYSRLGGSISSRLSLSLCGFSAALWRFLPVRGCMISGGLSAAVLRGCVGSILAGFIYSDFVN